VRLTVFGATGGTGTQVVRLALTAGHEVTAVVRDPARLDVPPDPNLLVVTADVMDPASIAASVAGRDAVVSTLGVKPGDGPTTVCAGGAEGVVAAMRETGVRRLLVVSSCGLTGAGNHVVLRATKAFARRTFLRHAYDDLRVMEDVVRASGLDWTIVRPPGLKDRPATGHYLVRRGLNIWNGWSISRTDLAQLLLDLSGDPSSLHQTVAVAD